MIFRTPNVDDRTPNVDVDVEVVCAPEVMTWGIAESKHASSQIACVIKDGFVAQELHQNGAVLVLRYLFERQLANFDFFFETSNGRLPPEQSSDRRETLAKRVSDDLQLFIFRP